MVPVAAIASPQYAKLKRGRKAESSCLIDAVYTTPLVERLLSKSKLAAVKRVQRGRGKHAVAPLMSTIFSEQVTSPRNCRLFSPATRIQMSKRINRIRRKKQSKSDIKPVKMADILQDI